MGIVTDKEFDLTPHKEDIIAAVKPQLDYALKNFTGFTNTPKIVSNAEDISVVPVSLGDGKMYSQINFVMAVKDCYRTHVDVYKVKINPFKVIIEDIRLGVVFENKNVAYALKRFMVRTFGVRYARKFDEVNPGFDAEAEAEKNL